MTEQKTSNKMDKLILSMNETFHICNLSRSVGYEEISAGRLKTFKRGHRRFSTMEWCKEYVELVINESRDDLERKPRHKGGADRWVLL